MGSGGRYMSLNNTKTKHSRLLPACQLQLPDRPARISNTLYYLNEWVEVIDAKASF